MQFLELMFYLIGVHFLVDHCLQRPEIGRGKNRNRPRDLTNMPPGQKPVTLWFHYLTGHAWVHGLGVALVLNPILGFAEVIAHWLIDFAKCENWTNPHQDQILHILTKIILVICYLVYFV